MKNTNSRQPCTPRENDRDSRSSAAEQWSSVELQIGRSLGADVGSKACDPSSEWIILRRIRKSQALLAMQNNFLASFDNWSRSSSCVRNGTRVAQPTHAGTRN